MTTFGRHVMFCSLLSFSGCVPFFETDPSGTLLSVDELGVDVGNHADLLANDASEELENDIGALESNVCGGPDPLRVEGVAERLGRQCGDCGAGFWVCNGPHQLRCAGAAPTNACGGCGSLNQDEGATCGECGDGVWACEGTVLTCSGARHRNVCGGCDVLPNQPGFACDSGTWQCDGSNNVQCVGGSRNACGRLGPLLDEDRQPAFAGDNCGPCSRGVLVCDPGGTGLLCEGSTTPNACGGCTALEGDPDTPCGVCDGVWVCSNPERVACRVSLPNRCGGCADLNADPVSCPDGRLICESLNQLACIPDSESQNLCGGTLPLLADPGDSCGHCESGVQACIGLDTLRCVDELGADARNSCGGCALMEAPLGTSCADCGVWRCRSQEPYCDLTECD